MNKSVFQWLTVMTTVWWYAALSEVNILKISFWALKRKTFLPHYQYTHTYLLLSCFILEKDWKLRNTKNGVFVYVWIIVDGINEKKAKSLLKFFSSTLAVMLYGGTKHKHKMMVLFCKNLASIYVLSLYAYAECWY